MPEEKSPKGKTPYPHAFRLHHWICAAALLFLLFSGVGIHFAARADDSITGGIYPAWMPTARLHMYHLVAAFLFLPTLVLISYSFIKRTRLKRWKSPRRFSEVLLVAGGGVATLTGLFLLNAWPGLAWARSVHGLAALLVLAGIVLHAILAVKLDWKGNVAAFHPFWKPAWAKVLFSLLLFIPWVVILFSGIPFVPSSSVLSVQRVETPQKGPESLPWENAPVLAIPLMNGMGFDAAGGETRVNLRAFHDGTDLFMLAEWKDDRLDLVNMPWERTSDGWLRRMSDPRDECIHYEDKFSLVFPSDSDAAFRRLGCAVYCHLGGGHPYGFKAAGEKVDVWHWKSVRSDPDGYLDDKYWHHLDMERKDKGRYGDPKEAGGYAKNVNDADTGPRFLYTSPDVVKGGRIPAGSTVPATPEKCAEISVGTIIPGIVSSPAIGDRGDVKCRSEHRDGWWRLWIRRKLDTGSPNDTAFRPGARHPFAAAAFDRAAKRHAYNHRVYYLELE